MAFLSAGNSRHDLGLVEAGPAARRDGTLGLRHAAPKAVLGNVKPEARLI